MASYTRFWLRALPLRRRWPLPALGPLWLSEAEPARRVLWPAGHGLLDRVARDMERQMHEMEKMSRAFFQASPLWAWEHDRPKEDGVQEGRGAEGQYRFTVDTAGFSPEETTVKLDGRRLTVTATRRKEGGENGGGWQERHELWRETLLPPDADLGALTCSLTADGQLCIEAPRRATEKTIPIDVKRATQETPDAGGDKEVGEKPKDP